MFWGCPSPSVQGVAPFRDACEVKILRRCGSEKESAKLAVGFPRGIAHVKIIDCDPHRRELARGIRPTHACARSQVFAIRS